MSAQVGTLASQIVTAAVCAVCGLVAGALLNVLVDRAPLRLTVVRSPSQCPACAVRLHALDMVPVASWLVLRGHCRHCATPISLRYPIVELVSAAMFAGTAVALGSVRPVAPVLVVTTCALAAAILDVEGTTVPAAIALLAAAAAGSLAPIAAGEGAVTRIAWAGLGAVLAFASAGIADRAAGPDRWSRLGVLCALGWSAGWLWAAGGPFVAAWVVVATAASGVGSGRRAPLAVLIGGSFAALLGAAVVNRP